MNAVKFVAEPYKKFVTIRDEESKLKLEILPFEFVRDEKVKIINIEHSILRKSRNLIIDSIGSGTGRVNSHNIYTEVIQPLFEDFGVQYDYFMTEHENSIKEIASSVEQRLNLNVIFLSGDTSINEFINNLAPTDKNLKLTILPIPCGTGNSLSFSVGIESKLASVERLFYSKEEPLFLYQAELPRKSEFLRQGKEVEIKRPLQFLVVISWAFHAAIVADSDTEEMRRHGIERFKMAAIRNLEKRTIYEGDTKLTSKLIQGPYAYWLLTPATKFEPTFEILPKGSIRENSLYLVAVEASYIDNLMEIMYEVYDKGNHVNDKRVIYEKIDQDSEVILEMKSPSKRICLDGDVICLPDETCQIRVTPRANKYNGWSTFILD